MLKQLSLIALLCSIVSALQIEAMAGLNARRMSRRVQKGGTEWMTCEYEGYRSNRANKRAKVNIYGYQIMGDEQVAEPLRLFFDITKLRNKGNTFKITLREGAIRTGRGCTMATKSTDLREFVHATPSDGPANAAIWRQDLDGTSINVLADPSKIKSSGRIRYYFNFEVADAAGNLDEMGCCTLKAVSQTEFIRNFKEVASRGWQLADDSYNAQVIEELGEIEGTYGSATETTDTALTVSSESEAALQPQGWTALYKEGTKWENTGTVNDPTDDYDTFTTDSTSMDVEVIPRITGIRLYYSEMDGECAGFQVIYSFFTAKDQMLMDVDTMVCGAQDIMLGFGQYIADVQATQFSADNKYRNSIKFILNDSTEFTCGKTYENYQSIIPQEEGKENAVISLSVGISTLEREHRMPVIVGANYVNLLDFATSQKDVFLSLTGNALEFEELRSKQRGAKSIDFDIYKDYVRYVQERDADQPLMKAAQSNTFKLTTRDFEGIHTKMSSVTIPRIVGVTVFADRAGACYGFDLTFIHVLYDSNKSKHRNVENVDALLEKDLVISDSYVLGTGDYINGFSISADKKNEGSLAIEFQFKLGDTLSCGTVDADTAYGMGHFNQGTCDYAVTGFASTISANAQRPELLYTEPIVTNLEYYSNYQLTKFTS